MQSEHEYEHEYESIIEPDGTESFIYRGRTILRINKDWASVSISSPATLRIIQHTLIIRNMEFVLLAYSSPTTDEMRCLIQFFSDGHSIKVPPSGELTFARNIKPEEEEDD